MSYVFKLNLDFKKILFYIFDISLCALTMLFIDIRLGIALFAAFIIAPIISGLSSYVFIKKIRINTHTSAETLNKNDTLSFDLYIDRGVLFSFFYIKISLLDPDILTSDHKGDIVIFPNNVLDESRLITYCAKNWGSADLGIKSFFVYDYLGLFVYELSATGLLRHRVEVIPNIPEISPNPLFEKCLEASDDDEERTISNFTQRTTPGYDHRKYTPGDSLKSINWKMSSKYDEYYVRLNEYLAMSLKQTFILDPSSSKESDVYSKELIIESILGASNFMFKNEAETSVIFYFNDNWQTHVIKNISDISQLQYKLAKYSFTDNFSTRIPTELIQKSGIVNVFSDNLDKTLLTELSNLSQNNCHVHTIISKPGKFKTENTWIVNDCFEFTHL